MQTLLQDSAYGWRMLRKSPGMTSIIVIMLTLGIGANTVVFTVFDAILLRPLRYEKPDQLVQLWQTRTEGSFQKIPFSYPNYADTKRLNAVFSRFGAYSRNSVTLSGNNGAEQIRVGVASADFFETLGVQPILGRSFHQEEDRQAKNPPVILTYGAWQRRFGGDPGAVGKTLVMDGELATVVGVLPRDFMFAPTQSEEMWISLRATDSFLRRNLYWLFPVARLKPGVSLQQAQAELSAVSRQLELQFPDANAGISTKLIDLRQEIVGQVQPVLIAVMAAIGFVLLITCANIAGLLLARSVPRQREISIRLAIGASRGRIARQLLTESVLLAFLGGGSAVLAAYWTVPAVVSLLPQSALLATPQLQGLAVNSQALWFVLTLSLMTGILFGLAPVVQTFKPSLQRDLQEAGRGTMGSANRRIRTGLVVSQMALAVVLLVGAGLLLKSLNRVLHTDPGFNTSNLLTGTVVLPANKYKDGPSQLAFQRRLLQVLDRLPGVEHTVAVTSLPMSGQSNTSRFDVEGHPKASGGEEYEANTPTVTQNYFAVMGIPLRGGRFFNSEDGEKSPHVVIVNQAMADAVFHNQNPVGKRINFTYTNEVHYLQIVGVVGNENVNRLDAPPTPIVYDCFEQDPSNYFAVAIRTKSKPGALAAAFTRTVRELEPEAPILGVITMEQVITDSPSMVLRAYPAYLIGGFAALALVLAALGLYGVLAYSVAQRTRELGVRIALGAQRGDLLLMVVNNGLKLAVIGIALGIAGGLVVARMIASLLFGVAPADIATFIGVSVALFMVALAASYIPALRATRVDPMVALRYE
jgi:putative ABC transport system permease protein